MYLYNISIIIENEQHDKFLEWLQKEWIKSLPMKHQFLKMLDAPHGGHTYCVQLHFEFASDIPAFQQNYLNALQQYIGENFMEKVFIFDSTMKYL